MIKRVIKYICLMSCIITTCFIVCIPVLAETSTYVVINSGDCIPYAISSYGTMHVSVNGNGVRGLLIKINNGNTNIVLVSPNNFMVSVFNYDSSCAVPNMSASKSGDYYVYYMNNPDWRTPVDFPLINCDNSKSIQNWGIYYTYGEGAVEPIEPINWGQLRNVNYSTKIAGSGQASMANIDTITWGTDFDSFGNPLNEDCEVEIRAVKGSWTASLKEDLLKMVGDTFNLSQLVAPTLATLPATQGTFSIEWDEVCNALDITTYLSLLAFLDTNNVYQKEGWIYEVRLINEADNYTGTWQRVYTATSGSASGSESIINNNSFNTIIYQEMQQIAILNNQETTIIIINDTEYPIENPDNGIDPDDPDDPDDTGVDLWDLIKIIQQGFFNVVNAIQSIPEKIGDLFERLFTLNEVDESVTEEINSITEQASEGQQNAINTLNVLEDIQDTLHNTDAQECIFTWDAVTLSMPGGNVVTLIPSGTHNFTDTFLDMIEGFGWTYQQYQEIVSAVIYCLVALFVYHHVTTFLRGYPDDR